MIYLGTQSVLLQNGLLITRAEFPGTPQLPVQVTGRVEFFDTSMSHAAAGDSRTDEVYHLLQPATRACIGFALCVRVSVRVPKADNFITTSHFAFTICLFVCPRLDGQTQARMLYLLSGELSSSTHRHRMISCVRWTPGV